MICLSLILGVVGLQATTNQLPPIDDLVPSIIYITTTPSTDHLWPATRPSPEIEKPLKFKVKATGTNLDYQWYKDGVAIVGATSSEYVIARLKPSDTGWYRVDVKNTKGSDSESKLLSAGLDMSIVPKPETHIPNGGKKVRYQVSTNFGARTFFARNLPPGLKIHPTTGVISGSFPPNFTNSRRDFTFTITAQKKQGNKIIYQTSRILRFLQSGRR